MNLEELVKKYYVKQGYNCSETLIHAANDYYHLNLHEDDMKLFAGYGSGMYVGSTCGALVGCIAALSKATVPTKAHDHLDTLRPNVQACVRNFKEALSGTDCKDVKPLHHSKETRCLQTCLLAAQALEQTISEVVK